jgi:hypothetical protein
VSPIARESPATPAYRPNTRQSVSHLDTTIDATRRIL